MIFVVLITILAVYDPQKTERRTKWGVIVGGCSVDGALFWFAHIRLSGGCVCVGGGRGLS